MTKKTTDKSAKANETVVEDSNGTAAMDSLHPNSKPGDSNPPSRTAIMAQLLTVMGGMGNSDLVDFFNKSLGLIGKEADQLPSGATAEHNKSTVAAKGTAKEEFDSILGTDEQLSEDFKTRTATLFEAAIESRIILEKEKLKEEYEAALESSTKKIHEELTTRLDAYTDSVVSEWIEKNKVAIQSNLKLEVMEEFIDGLKKLFIDHYIDIPEEKVSVVETLTKKVESLETKLDEALVDNKALKDELEESNKTLIIKEEAVGLALTQAEKFTELASNIEIGESLETFRTKIRTIRENQFDNKKPTTKTSISEDVDGVSPLNEEKTSADELSSVNPEMRKYVAALKKISG